jgi:predicted metalloprotease with PDZ domain
MPVQQSNNQHENLPLLPPVLLSYSVSPTGSVTGVGLEITYDGAAGSDIVVLTPTAGGPADKAGVKAGDVIVSVDGTPTKGLSLYDVSDLLQGEADSQVGNRGTDLPTSTVGVFLVSVFSRDFFPSLIEHNSN